MSFVVPALAGGRTRHRLKAALRNRQRGYALTLVLVFIVLFLMLMGVAYRGIAAALRLESVRTFQLQRDEGSVHALARGLALLETGAPPSETYACHVAIGTSAGSRDFTVSFVKQTENTWSIRAAPSQSVVGLPFMPVTFATP